MSDKKEVSRKMSDGTVESWKEDGDYIYARLPSPTHEGVDVIMMFDSITKYAMAASILVNNENIIASYSKERGKVTSSFSGNKEMKYGLKRIFNEYNKVPTQIITELYKL
jgi:hypothetical protein